MGNGESKTNEDPTTTKTKFVESGQYTLDHTTARPKRSTDDGNGVDTIHGSFSLRDESNVHLCSAFLIQPLLLLTAAHCILGKSLKGMKASREGPKTLDLINGSEQSLFPISQVMIHPNFDFSTLDNDIALVRLDPNSRQYGSSFGSLSPTPPSTWKLHKTAILAGWDLAESTATAGGPSSAVYGTYKVRTFKRPDCLALYESDDTWNRTITGNMFCAWYVGEDSCKEIESGGLLFCGTDTPYICGIGSWGYGCGSDFLPMVYTNVSKYVPWIETHMGVV